MKEIDYAVKYYEAVTKGKTSFLEREKLYWDYRGFIKDEIRQGRGFNKKLLSSILELHIDDYKKNNRKINN